MAHNLFGSRYVGARGVPAWHGLGKTLAVGVDISVEDAVREADMDFPYIKVPVGYTTPDGDFVNSGQRSMVLRGPSRGDPSWAELGVVSNDYTFLQNVELAQGLDAIAKATGWSFETIGALGRGETVFMTLRTGKRSVFGDNYNVFLIVSDGKCAQRALQITIALVRVVCENTLLMSDSGSLVKITISHDEDVAGEYRFWLDLIQNLQSAQDAAISELEQMASVKITDKQAANIIQKAWPLPGTSKKGKQAEALLKLPTLTEAQRLLATDRLSKGDAYSVGAREQVVNRRMGALELYKRFNAGQEMGIVQGGNTLDPDTLLQVKNTPYAAVQAVTEMIDWGGATSASVAGASALFGNGAEVKQRAWSEALKLATR